MRAARPAARVVGLPGGGLMEWAYRRLGPWYLVVLTAVDLAAAVALAVAAVVLVSFYVSMSLGDLMLAAAIGAAAVAAASLWTVMRVRPVASPVIDWIASGGRAWRCAVDLPLALPQRVGVRPLLLGAAPGIAYVVTALGLAWTGALVLVAVAAPELHPRRDEATCCGRLCRNGVCGCDRQARAQSSTAPRAHRAGVSVWVWRVIRGPRLDESFHGSGRSGRVEGDISSQVEVGGAIPHRRPEGASMDADLDLLLIAVFCTADEFLPSRAKNAKRMVTDAEVVTLAVAQQLLGITSDEQFCQTAPRRLGHLFPQLPQRPGYVKRRQRLAEQIEALIEQFAWHTAGAQDDVLVVDSTPIECARSVETTRRSRLGDAADYGYCASHSRFFWGFRLHGIFALDGTPRALRLTSPKAGERDVCLAMLDQLGHTGPIVVIGDKGYAGRDFQTNAADLGATIVRPAAKTNPGKGRTSRRSASASRASFRPAKTSSASTGRARATCTPCAAASPPSSSRSPPRSPSTQCSAEPPATSRPTTPEPIRVEQLI